MTGRVDDPKPLDVKGLAEHLGVSTAWIYRQCRARLIPHSVVAGQLRFTTEHVRLILANGDRPVVGPPNNHTRRDATP